MQLLEELTQFCVAGQKHCIKVAYNPYSFLMCFGEITPGVVMEPTIITVCYQMIVQIFAVCYSWMENLISVDQS